MKKKKLIGSLLALTLVGGVATTSHAQAATAHSLGAQHDAYTAHQGASAPAPDDTAWTRKITAAAGKLWAAGTDFYDAVFGDGGSAAARPDVQVGERIFDQPSVR